MDESIYWIVVVDDDIANLRLAGTILSENGMRVTALNSGRALLERIKAGITPDLILLDILMPGMDGFETFSELRRIESETSGKHIPVLFLTADDNKETREKALSLGALDLVTKPFVPELLTEKTEYYLTCGDCPPLRYSGSTVSSELLRQELKRQLIPFGEQVKENGALISDRPGFEAINRFMTRYTARYGGNVQRVLLKLSPASDDVPDSEVRKAADELEDGAGVLLRKSDVLYRSAPDSFLLLVPMVTEEELDGIIGRVISVWEKERGSSRVSISHASESLGDVREERPDIDGLDWRYAQMNLPNDRLLTNTVNEFAESMPDRLERLERSYSSIDKPDSLNSYRIEVHAMKSAAAAVGLLSLSGAARILEEAARSGSTADITALHPLFAKTWKQTYANVCGALGLEIRDENKAAAAKVSPALLDVLKNGIENMDTEAVDGALKKIMSREYDPGTAAVLQKLKKAAIEFDDSAFDIIKELLT